MATQDSIRAARRFLTASRRIVHGLEQQRKRIMDRSAPTSDLGDPAPPVVDLVGEPGNDLDYYAYELARLQDLARQIIKSFSAPPVVLDGLARFEAAIPALRRVRNPLTHPSDDARLDGVAWFGAVVELRADGGVDYLIDPRYEHHDSALELARILTDYLTDFG